MGLSLVDLKDSKFSWADFKGRVAILGFGLEGQATLSYLLGSGLSLEQIIIYDAKKDTEQKAPQGIQFHGGDDYITKLNANSEIDVIFRSPPINPSLISSGAIIWSGTNEFFARVKTLNLIGVTGTKGKGTTSSLIHQMLLAQSKKSYLLGNIGQPALSLIDQIQAEDYAVIELSSFQLWDVQFSPRIAVILMITEDHLDVHSDLEDYRNAKFNITKFQRSDDALIYFSQNEVSAQFGTKSPAGKKMPYPSSDFAHVSGSEISFGDQTICSVSDVKLIGEHNLENVMAAVNAAEALNLSSAAIKKAIINFGGLPHRLQLVREIGNLKFFNDSYSSNPSATMRAIQSINEPVVLMVGGFDRNISFGDLAKQLKLKSPEVQTLIYGQNRTKIAESFDSKNYSQYQVSESSDFSQIIEEALSLAKRSGAKVLLFSPGSASFDMFGNFNQRGQQFIDIINKL